jgi:hypothetical protein
MYVPNMKMRHFYDSKFCGQFHYVSVRRALGFTAGSGLALGKIKQVYTVHTWHICERKCEYVVAIVYTHWTVGWLEEGG